MTQIVPGQQIGTYQIIKKINSGSFGSVYTARHIVFSDEPIVAIKVLHAYLGSQQEIDHFFQEARILHKLQHPHILPLIDAGMYQDLPYLVLLYAPEGSLYDRLHQKTQKPFSLEEALQIISQIGQALQYAHEQNIVHRDLKPANILFTKENKALLADFGIAVITEKTRHIDENGTPPYMAPEQFHGTVSKKSDQYALGCIAYELVTGQKAFVLAPGSDFVAWGYQHTSVPPLPPTQINPRLPLHIEQAILRALAKERDERYPDVTTFVTTLQKSSQQWLEEGDQFFDQKHYEDAISAFEQALRLTPDLVLAHYNRGYASLILGRPKEAAKAYTAAILLNPDLLFTHLFKDKLIHFVELNQYKPFFVSIIQTFIHIFDQHLPPVSALTLTQILKAVEVACLAGTFKSAELRLPVDPQEEVLAILEEAIEQVPDSLLAYFAKALALRWADRKSGDMSTFLRQVLELSSQSFIAGLTSILILAIIDHNNDAKTVFNQIVDNFRNDSLLNFLVGSIGLRVLEKQDKRAATILAEHQEYANALRDEIAIAVPNSPIASVITATILVILGLNTKALILLNKALEIDSTSLFVYVAKLLVLLLLEENLEEEIEEVLAVLQNVAEHTSDPAFAYIVKAFVYPDREQVCLAALRQAARLDPDLLLIHLLKALAFLGYNHEDDCLDEMKQVIRLAPNSAFAYLLKALALTHFQHKEKALAVLEHFMRLVPDSAFGYFFKASVLYDLNYSEASQRKTKSRENSTQVDVPTWQFST